MSTSPKEPMDVEKVPLGRSLLISFGIAAVYAILSVTRMKNGDNAGENTSKHNRVFTQRELKQGTQSPPAPTLVSQGSTVDQPLLIDAGLIQVVLVITAIAFTIRAFTVTEFQALSLFGYYIFVDRINITQLANVVFIASGTISMLLYGVYLWEWMDKNFRLSGLSRSRVLLALFGLIAHISFLFLLAAILILQILTRNVIPE